MKSSWIDTSQLAVVAGANCSVCFPRKHTTTRLSDILVCSLSHICQWKFEWINKTSLTLWKTAKSENLSTSSGNFTARVNSSPWWPRKHWHTRSKLYVPHSQTKMAPKRWNRMVSRSIPAALVHKTRESDFGKNDTISIRSPSSNAINNKQQLHCSAHWCDCKLISVGV